MESAFDPIVLSAIITANAGIVVAIIQTQRRTNGHSPLATKLDAIGETLEEVDERILTLEEKCQRIEDAVGT